MQQTTSDTGIPFYLFAQWQAESKLIHGIFGRHGGVSASPWASLNVGASVGDDPQAVISNAERMYSALGFRRAQACTVWQVHGTEVIVAQAPRADMRWIAQADILLTDQPGLPLSMRFADCVPILLYDPLHPAIGIVHAGWRGTLADAAGVAVRAMRDSFGSDPKSIQAAIGPSIGPECYEVGPEVVEATIAAFGDLDGLIHEQPNRKPHLDLWSANTRALRRAGVTQIEVSGLCTACHTDTFFSHRAEHGKTGRFGAVIALSADQE